MRYFAILLSGLLLASCAGSRLAHVKPPMQPQYSFRERGQFKPQFYALTVEEEAPAAQKTVPLLNASGDTLAHVTPKFAATLLEQKQGKLADGRVVMQDEQEPSRYVLLEQAPFGVTSLGFKRIPYRTVAVNPQRILPGKVLFIPKAYGVVLPNGEIHDGFFLVQDVRKDLRPGEIALFVGDDRGKKPVFARAGMAASKPVPVYSAGEPWASGVKARFAEQFAWRARKPLYKMVASEIDALIRETSRRVNSVPERLAIYSERGKGTPYLIFLLGEGPVAKYDRDPLMDFARVDCMTFCEQMLAMAISDSFSQMFRRLQRIRYKDGIIGFKTRNHYTIADWLPNNHWLLEDATRSIGGDFTREMTKVIDRRAFFHRAGLPDSELVDIPPPEEITAAYVPAEHLVDVKDRLQGGEIVSIVTTMPGIISAHMGMIVRDAFGNVIFRHGSSSKRNAAVVDERIEDVAAYLQKSKNRVGMIFMRVRPDWVYPGGPATTASAAATEYGASGQ